MIVHQYKVIAEMDYINKSKLFKIQYPCIYKSIVWMPTLFLLVFLTAGAGHGTYFFFKLVYPYTMLSALHFGEMQPTIIVAGIFQYVFYGLLLTYVKSVNQFKFMSIMLFAVHFFSFWLCLYIFRDF